MSTERRLGLSVPTTRFGEWRAVRPFLGGVLLALGGVVIVAVVLSTSGLVLGRANPSPVALVAAAGAYLCGVFALANPSLSKTFGIAGTVSAIVAVVGTPFLGFLGILLSVVGGNLCIAWESGNDATDDAGDTEAAEDADDDPEDADADVDEARSEAADAESSRESDDTED